MSRKLFVVSDVHGYFTALRDALSRAGFDSANEDHIFVSCGDLFDRGVENARVYDFVRSLERKILIKGNHEDILRDVLECGRLSKTDVSNGTNKTISEFFGERAVNERGEIVGADKGKIKEILEFIDSMSDFYEEGDYIFTHGWLPIILDKWFRPTLDPSWREADGEAWREARWLGWWQLYDKGATLKGKTIVCGHRPARLGRMFDELREPDCDSPFFGKGVIAIDTYTARSGRVEVLQIDSLT